MRAIIFIMMSAAALVSCTPDNNEVTGSINDCARKLFTPYNPKNMKQCVAVCIACESGVHHLLDILHTQRRALIAERCARRDRALRSGDPVRSPLQMVRYERRVLAGPDGAAVP